MKSKLEFFEGDSEPAELVFIDQGDGGGPGVRLKDPV